MADLLLGIEAALQARRVSTGRRDTQTWVVFRDRTDRERSLLVSLQINGYRDAERRVRVRGIRPCESTRAILSFKSDRCLGALADANAKLGKLLSRSRSARLISARGSSGP